MNGQPPLCFSKHSLTPDAAKTESSIQKGEEAHSLTYKPKKRKTVTLDIYVCSF